MNIVVTGAGGNLGSHLCQSSEHHFIKLGRGESTSLADSLKGNADCAIHCAYDLKNSLVDEPEKVMDSNLISTARILQEVKKHHIPHFIFISTCAVYGESSDTSESHFCVPTSNNGLIKLLNEKMVADFCQKHQIKYHILRVFNLYGGNDHFSVVSKLLAAAKKGTHFHLNNDGLSQRDFIHVSDVAKITLKIAAKRPGQSIINVGTGEPNSIKSLVEFVQKKKPNLKFNRSSNREVEYSRANVNYLQSLFDYRFINIFDFLAQELAT